jgi:hypothetical protein
MKKIKNKIMDPMTNWKEIKISWKSQESKFKIKILRVNVKHYKIRHIWYKNQMWNDAIEKKYVILYN